MCSNAVLSDNAVGFAFSCVNKKKIEHLTLKIVVMKTNAY